MKAFLTGTLLGALMLTGAGAMWLAGGGSGAVAVLAGGLLPLVISVGSLVVFFLVLQPGKMGQKSYQRFVLTNFFIKVFLLGGWLAAILLATSLPRIPFIASLLLNFMAWHVYEAYRYQSAVGRAG